MGLSQHKEVERECPRCRTVKTFPARNETCGCKPPKVDPEQEETHEIKDDSWKISIPKTTISTLPELVAHCKIDLKEWTVKKATFGKWDSVAIPRPEGSTQKGWSRKSGAPIINQLFKVSVELVPNVEYRKAKDSIAELVDAAKKYWPAYAPFKRKPEGGNMLELDIFDTHLGKLAWGAETGGHDYDLKIAANRFEEAVEALISRTKHFGIEQIVVPIGNDFQQADDKDGQTTRGTKVDTDGRYQKAFKKGHQLLVNMADRLSAIAPVKLIVVPGNHDELSAWSMGFALECWFRNSKDVTVDNGPRLFKVHEFYKCMLGLLHGHGGKRKDYGLMMATEFPAMFGRTRHREVHTAHFHADRVASAFGIKTRTLRALCPADAWHAANGFIGQQEGAEAFVWNKEEGIIGGAVYTIPRKEVA